MNRIWTLAMGLALACGVLTADGANAQTCASGCGPQLKACVQTARMAKMACILDCRTNAAPGDRGACSRACRDDFRSAQGSCRADLGSCVGGCDAPALSTNSSPSCLGGCGQGLGACAHGVAATGHACVVACRTADDRLGCLKSCAADARSGAAACASDFGSCRASCGAPTTTTTLPPPASCENSEAPVCGGSCQSAVQTCMPVGPTRCACVGGSPSNAFLE